MYERLIKDCAQHNTAQLQWRRAFVVADMRRAQKNTLAVYLCSSAISNDDITSTARNNIVYFMFIICTYRVEV